MPSPRQCPTPVTTTWSSGPVIARLDAGGVGRREQLSVPQRQRRKRDIHRELRLERMAEIGAGGAHRNVGRGWRARRAPPRSRAPRRWRPRSRRRWPGDGRRERLPHPRQRRRAVAPGCRLLRSDTTAARRASGLAPRASACSRASSTRKAPSEPSAMPPPLRARSQTGANAVLQRMPAERVEQHADRAVRRCRRRRRGRCRSGRPRRARARSAPRRRRPPPRP